MLSDEERKRLQATLDRLTEYRKRDPGFKGAIAACAKAEAALGDDPVDGEIGELIDGRFQPLFSPPK